MKQLSIELYDALSGNENIIIGGHINPDGDTIGACLAMAQSVALIGKKPVVVFEQYSKKFDFIKGEEYVYNGNLDDLAPDVFIAIDCGSKDRLGEASKVFDKAKKTFNIDHHISNTEYADINIVDENASSSSEIIFDVIKIFCIINEHIASAIYTGIISDTCGFKHACTTRKTHEVAGRLLEFGIPFSDIQDKILYNHSIEEVRAFSKALNNMKVEGNIAYTTLTLDELKSCNATNNDLDGIVSYLLNINGIEASLFVYEKANGKTKASLRSKSIDVNKLTQKHGGGGHVLAAGADFDLPIEDVKNLILEDIKNELK